MKQSPRTSSAKAQPSGFTLIELLVVIAIIAILMGLLFPVISAVMENGRKVQAKNDETQIVLAVKAYHTDYGKYPIVATKMGHDVVYTTDNNELIDVLRNRTGTNIGNLLNPRGVIYLTPSIAKDDAHPKAGVQNSTGVWFDPWGAPYNIALDGDADDVLNSTASPLPNFYSDMGQLQQGVIVWATGKNGEAGGGAATKPAFSSESGTPGKLMGSGDVVSW